MESQLPESIEPGIRDTRLIERAIRQRWPIPENMRQALIERQIEIATSVEVSPREATSAFNAVMAADKQNQAAEQKPRRKKQVQPTIVFMEGNIDDAKRQLLDRANRICADSARAGTDSPGSIGTGEPVN
jgi:hypothetical protein